MYSAANRSANLDLMYLRLLFRFIMLAIAFALVTLGILGWQSVDFDLQKMWPVASLAELHPVYLMALGMALIPPTLWEIFILEMQQFAQQAADNPPGE